MATDTPTDASNRNDGTGGDEIESLRSKSNYLLSCLTVSSKISEGNEKYKSWIRGTEVISKGGFEPTDRTRFFDTHGFLLVKGFADIDTQVPAMKMQMESLVQNMWNPESEMAIFRTDEGQIDAQGRNAYFLKSADQIHFFAEKGAIGGDGNLKEEFRNKKINALNKVGHGLHLVPGAFHDYSTSTKIRSLVHELGWVNPVLPQSMYIFKQGKVGSEVTSHQDSTFLFTEPKQTCLGLWLALDDSTLENGCLWVRPGSHVESVRRKFVRNPDYFGNDGDGGDVSQPMMIFEDLCRGENGNIEVTWDGTLPEGSDLPLCQGLFEAGFVPVECGAGDLLVFPGTLDHLSLPNYSSKARHTFQLHLVEGEGEGVRWAKSNWLQYPDENKFLSMD